MSHGNMIWFSKDTRSVNCYLSCVPTDTNNHKDLGSKSSTVRGVRTNVSDTQKGPRRLSHKGQKERDPLSSEKTLWDSHQDRYLTLLFTAQWSRKSGHPLGRFTRRGNTHRWSSQTLQSTRQEDSRGLIYATRFEDRLDTIDSFRGSTGHYPRIVPTLYPKTPKVDDVRRPTLTSYRVGYDCLCYWGNQIVEIYTGRVTV